MLEKGNFAEEKGMKYPEFFKFTRDMTSLERE